MNLLRFFRRRRSDADLSREIAAHLEAERAENLARGLTPEEADRHARIKFGSARRVHEDLWQQNSALALEGILRDLRYALRTLARTPGFTLTAIAVMTLGIGATAALFTVVKSVLLNPLPYADPAHLVTVYESEPHGKSPSPWLPVDAGSFEVWRRAAQPAAELALVSPWQQYNLSASGGKLPETLSAAWCSANLFRTLGVAPALGRDFAASDDRPGAPATVILSHSLWKRRYNGDPAVIGTSIWLDGSPHTVIGVMPASFAYPTSKIQIWTAVHREAPAPLLTTFSDHEFIVIARLLPGVTRMQLAAQLDTLQQAIAKAHPEPAIHHGAMARSLLDDIVEDYKTPLYTMLAATGCVLLIACLNVANLLVARSAARQRDLAVRAALGGTRWRLVREHLSESLLLCAAGGIAGLVLAYGALLWLAHTPVELARADSIHLDGIVLLFVLALATLCGVLAGLVPALALRHHHLLESLQQTSRSHSAGAGRVRARKALLAAEVGLTVVLLTAAGLLLKSYQRLRTADIGMPTENVLSMRFTLPELQYKEVPQRVAFFQQLIARVRALPGVTAAALVTAAPGQGWGGDITASVLERPPQSPNDWVDLMHRGADPGYFSAMQIPLLRGRFFTPEETLNHDQVAIISQSAARQLFPNEDPIGRHIKMHGDSTSHEIVGIVGDTRWLASQPVRPTMYMPLYNGDYSHATILVRTTHDVESLAVPVQKVIATLDPNLPVADVMTLDESIGKSTQQAGFNSTLVLVFALIALALAAVGLYGVLSYVVTQRTGELGIRIALGAQRAEVLRLTLADGLTPVFSGMLIGMAAGAAVVQFLREMLYGMSPFDWSVFSGVVLVLAIAAASACALPAWRATRLDPAQALRAE
jgi:predicted permease